MILYADDKSLIFTEANIVSSQTKITDSMNLTGTWFLANNIDKIQLIGFNNSLNEIFDINFRNSVLKPNNILFPRTV